MFLYFSFPSFQRPLNNLFNISFTVQAEAKTFVVYHCSESHKSLVFVS